MSSLSSSINKSNNKFISVLENPIVKYSVLILITLLIIFIEKIDTNVLEVFDLCLFKIIYALLIAYTACFDPIYAIILTTFLIMAIQELHNRRTKSAIKTHKLAKTENFKEILSPSNQRVVYESLPSKDTLINNKTINDFINKGSLQKIPDSKDTLDTEYDYYEDPAFKTITNNLQ